MFCPHCGARLGDRPDLAGQWFSCPSCAAPFQVPLPPPQPSGVLHSAHAAGQSGSLQKAIPVKQAVAVGPAAPRQPAGTAQASSVQGGTAPAAGAVQSNGVHSNNVHATVPVSHAAAAATVHGATVRPAPHTQPRAPVQGVPVQPTARRRRSPTAAVPRHPTDGLAVVGLGLGLLGLPLGMAPYYGFVVSGFGAALAVAGLLSAVKRRLPGGLAVAALATSGIGLCFQITMWNLHWRERPETTLTAVSGAAGAKPGNAPAAAAASSAAPAATLSPSAAQAYYEPWQQQRHWTIGDKQVLARLKGWTGERAILELADGEELNTSQSALSEADRQWVAGLRGK
jgi:hypothetical protein